MGAGLTFKPPKKRDWQAVDSQHKHRGARAIVLMIDMESYAATPPDLTGVRGRPKIYSDDYVTAALTLKVLLRQPLRCVEGMIRQMFVVGGIDMPVPDHTTLSRRCADVKTSLPKLKPNETVVIVADGTGLKVTGEGEWKTKIHGKTKRRKWRKVSLALDPATGIIYSVTDTSSDNSEMAMFPDLMADLPLDGTTVIYDGAADGRNHYDTVAARGGQLLTPPRHGSRVNTKLGENDARNKAVRGVRKLGRSEWKQATGYHTRSCAEAAMHRFKRLGGNSLAFRIEERQSIEIRLRVSVLNDILMNHANSV